MKNLRLDYLLDPSMQLYQNPDHFCFNTDTRLLAQFMKIRQGERVIDIGTNNGALLLAADRCRPSSMTGIEVLKEAAETARENTRFFTYPVEWISLPVQDVETEPADVILSNPPYFEKSASHPDTKVSMRQLGRIEENLTLEELMEHASRLLKSCGRFYLVHRPCRMAEIFEKAAKYSLYPKDVQIAYDKRDSQAKSLLVEFIKERKGQTRILPAIYIG